MDTRMDNMKTASAQSDQHLCCSKPRQYSISMFSIRNFKPLAGFFSWAGRFVSYLVANPKDKFSYDEAQISIYLFGMFLLLQRRCWSGSKLLFFIWVLQPVKIISFILRGKMGDSREKPPDHPQSELGSSHVTSARLEPKAVRWWAI